MDIVQPQLRTAQILVGALLAGVATFAAVVASLVASGSLKPQQPDLVLPLGVGLAALFVAGVVAAVGVGRLVVRANREAWAKHPDPEPDLMLMPFVSLTIMRAAFLEGPAILGVVALLLTGEWAMLAGTVLGAAGLLLIMPTRDRFDAFIQNVSGRQTI